MNENHDRKNSGKMSKKKMGIFLIGSVLLLCVFCLIYIRLSIGGAPGPSQSETNAPAETNSPTETISPTTSPSSPAPLPGDETQNPEPTSSNTEAIVPEPGEPYEWDQNNEAAEPGATYSNVGYFSYEYDPYGAFLCVGVKTDVEANMVYLNPKATVSGFPDTKIGFYITPSRGDISYAYEGYAGKNDGENANHQYFAIDVTYDELTPADYVDSENYGIGWRNNFLDDGKMYEGADIYIRAIDLTHGNKMLTTAKATIVWDEQAKTYKLAGLKNADVAYTGEITAEERNELVSRAYALASNPRYFSNQSVANSLNIVGSREEAEAKAIVQYLGDTTYFSNMVSTSGQSRLSSMYTDQFSNIFAVTIPVAEKGFITLYYSPDAWQMSYDVDDPDNSTGIDLSPITSLGLNFFGTDLYNPETRNS